MTATLDTQAAGSRGTEEGLREPPMTPSEHGASGEITPRRRLDAHSSEQEEFLPMSGSAVESSERLAAVVSQSLSGKSRLRGRALARCGSGGHHDRPKGPRGKR
jgi:hypothetical protein